MSPTFTALEVRNYRLWFIGGFVSNVGTWIGRVGQDWLVLTVLTAGSATALGVVTGLQFLPFLLLAPWSGLIADRFSRRRILLVTQSLLALTSLVLGRARGHRHGAAVARLRHRALPGHDDGHRQPRAPGLRLRDGARRTS